MQTRRLPEGLEEYIDKVPFLSLHGKYGNPLEALKDYYETKVEVYFIGIYPVEEGEINGMDFCRLLSSSTRVIFITDTDRYAAECFRLDALDYLMDGLNFSTFFQSVSKAARWFSLQDAGTSDSKHRQGPEEVPKVIYMRCDNRIMRLDLERINYIEGMGDYVKIFCKDSPKPILSLCSMKYNGGKNFRRTNLSACTVLLLSAWTASAPSGAAHCSSSRRMSPLAMLYRERVKGYVSRLAVL